MSRTFLKVRLKELANEARIIRREESSVARQKEFLKKKQGKEADYEYAVWLFKELKQHRKTIVRRAARETQVAYAFLRGKQFKDIERRPLRPWEIARLWTGVGRLIYQYGKTERYPLPIILENTQEFKRSNSTLPTTALSYEVFSKWIDGEDVNVINRR